CALAAGEGLGDATDVIRTAVQSDIACYAAGVANLTMFQKPKTSPFPVQRITGLDSKRRDAAGLKRFEPCPEGYTFVDADIGGGAFARVFLVRNEATQDLQAMKRVDRQKLAKHFQISAGEAEQMVEQEFWQMQRTNHPHIIKLFDFFQDERYAYFVMEAVNGGTLRQLLNTLNAPKGERPKLSEGFIAEMLQQALYALRHLHYESRIHKDVKLENLMLLSTSGPPHLVLIDLGVAETFQSSAGDARPMPAGTPQTMAPEVIDCMLGRRSSFDDRCDVFSLGIVAHQLFTGDVPYKVAYRGGGSYGPVDYAQTRTNMNCDLTAQLKSAGCSRGVITLVSRMLEMDPAKRPSTLECLSDDWLVQKCENRRLRRLRLEGRHSLGGAALSVEEEEAAGEELLRLERRRICKALVRFAKRTPLQRAVAFHLASYLPVGDLRRAAESFKRVDNEQSGHLTYDEIANALEEVLGIEREHGLRVATAMDTDQSGRLDFQEFSAAVAVLRGEREQRLYDTLLEKMQIDPAKDLTLQEVHAAVEVALKGPVTREMLVEWLTKVAKSALPRIALGPLQCPSGRCCEDPQQARCSEDMGWHSQYAEVVEEIGSNLKDGDTATLAALRSLRDQEPHGSYVEVTNTRPAPSGAQLLTVPVSIAPTTATTAALVTKAVTSTEAPREPPDPWKEVRRQMATRAAEVTRPTCRTAGAKKGCERCCSDGHAWRECFDVETCAAQAPPGGKYAFVLAQVQQPGQNWLPYLENMREEADRIQQQTTATVDIVVLIPTAHVGKLRETHWSRLKQFGVQVVKVPWELPPELHWWPDNWHPGKVDGWCGPQDLVRLHTTGLDSFDAVAFYDQDVEFHSSVSAVFRCASLGYFLSTSGGVGEPLNIGFFALRPDRRLVRAAELFAWNITFDHTNGWGGGGFKPAGGYFVGAECGQGYFHTLYYHRSAKAKKALDAAEVPAFEQPQGLKMRQIDQCVWNYQTGSHCPYKFDCNLVKAHHKPTQKEHGRDCPKLKYRSATTTTTPATPKEPKPCQVVQVQIGASCKCGGVFSKSVVVPGAIQDCERASCNNSGDQFSISFTGSRVTATREGPQSLAECGDNRDLGGRD
ncbi:CPK1, partial [Symbiodinium microadriaticum]